MSKKKTYLERSSPYDLVWNLPLQLHEHSQHLVVGVSGKHDFATEELVYAAANTPEVDLKNKQKMITMIIKLKTVKILKTDRKVIFQPEDDFRRPVESRHQVGRGFGVRNVGRGSEIAQFQHGLGLVDQDVVGLDVCVDDVALFHQFESHEQLLGVGPDRVDVDANVLAVLLEHLPQVHGEGFEGQAQVLLVEKVPVQTEAVELVVGVSLVDPPENL